MCSSATYRLRDPGRTRRAVLSQPGPCYLRKANVTLGIYTGARDVASARTGARAPLDPGSLRCRSSADFPTGLVGRKAEPQGDGFRAGSDAGRILRGWRGDASVDVRRSAGAGCGRAVVTATQVNLVDGAGRLRGVLAGSDPGGLASITLYDQTGQARSTMAVEPDGTPLIQLHGPGGETRLRATVQGNDASDRRRLGSRGAGPVRCGPGPADPHPRGRLASPPATASDQ